MLTNQDLSWADDINEYGGANRPIAALYDSLVRPGADLGEAGPSCLQWEVDSSREIPHVVLGDTEIGGSWNSYDPEMLAVSFAQWLDLPGYGVADYLGREAEMARIPAALYVAYMRWYADTLGIQRNFETHARVTSITKHGSLWLVEGRHSDGRRLSLTARYVILASGKTIPKMLGLPEEENCRNIVYDVPSMKKRLALDTMKGKEYTQGSTTSRVVVVGDGISSADVIRHCLQREIPVLHVIRRNERQLRNILLSRLSAVHYTDYHEIYRLMIGRETNPLYERITNATVTKVDQHRLRINYPKGEKEESYGLLAVCIGRTTDTSTLLHGKFTFDGDYCSVQDETLLSAGALSGDHFVRYLVGGCLDVVQRLKKQIRRNDPAKLSRNLQMALNNNNDAILNTISDKKCCVCPGIPRYL
ncbi:hypothetical protein WR25_22377 [Diploscapter pachys]|uniref:Uncharacterized protein n=1 Tax=Diploscapter pachys TaxID=2018661 RepID=A0A2A2L4S9_9BILA|nr:hypothetical protein WR25_22377 [Diploscapter pachys]